MYTVATGKLMCMVKALVGIRGSVSHSIFWKIIVLCAAEARGKKKKRIETIMK